MTNLKFAWLRIRACLENHKLEGEKCLKLFKTPRSDVCLAGWLAKLSIANGAGGGKGEDLGCEEGLLFCHPQLFAIQIKYQFGYFVLRSLCSSIWTLLKTRTPLDSRLIYIQSLTDWGLPQSKF